MTWRFRPGDDGGAIAISGVWAEFSGTADGVRAVTEASDAPLGLSCAGCAVSSSRSLTELVADTKVQADELMRSTNTAGSRWVLADDGPLARMAGTSICACSDASSPGSGCIGAARATQMRQGGENKTTPSAHPHTNLKRQHKSHCSHTSHTRGPPPSLAASPRRFTTNSGSSAIGALSSHVEAFREGAAKIWKAVTKELKKEGMEQQVKMARTAMEQDTSTDHIESKAVIAKVCVGGTQQTRLCSPTQQPWSPLF